MSKWITHRNPDSSDGQMVFNQFGEMTHYLTIKQGEPWMPIAKPEPYVKTKRWVLDWSVSGDCWILKDTQKVYTATLLNMCIEGDDSETDKERTREAAEEIASIYERVNP